MQQLHPIFMIDGQLAPSKMYTFTHQHRILDLPTRASPYYQFAIELSANLEKGITEKIVITTAEKNAKQAI